MEFTITRTVATSRPRFSVSDATVGCGFSWSGTGTYGTGLDLAWWGYEKNDMSSGLGTDAAFAKVNMSYMAYNTNASGTWVDRTDLTNRVDGWSCPDCVHRDFSSTDNKSYLVTIGDDYFNNDLFNVQTDY